MPLKDIKFSDLYLGKTDSWLSGVPNTNDPIPAPAECQEELITLRESCSKIVETSGREEFSVAHDGVTYRSSLLKSISEDVFVLRKFPETVPDLDALGLNSSHVKLLLQQKLTGLIVIAGAYGQGKTTTASALIAGRISRFGGVAVCIEDPPEMPMEGKRGEGVIYQRWAEEGGFAHECRQAARWAPSIIFVGEVRDAETATEALKASINGRLVVCTIHSNCVCTAVERLFTLANGVAGSSDDVANLMSVGMRAVVHQRLEGEPKRPKLEFMFVDEADNNIQSLIKQKKFAQLANEIVLQRNKLLMSSRDN